MRTNLKLSSGEIERLQTLYVQSRSPQYRDRLVEAHLYIAEIIARKFSGRGVDFDDLYQVASLALVKAVERFDPGRGVKLASFVTPGMVGEVKNYCGEKGGGSRPAGRASERAGGVDGAGEAVTQQRRRGGRVDEIARHTGLTEDEVLEAMEASAAQPVSLDMQTSDDDEELNLTNVLGAEEKGFSEFETADMLRRGMEKLNEQQQEIIRLRFFENLSQREVAQRIGVSQMSVSRAERGALERLRQALTEQDT